MRKIDWNHPMTRRDYLIVCAIVGMMYFIWLLSLGWYDDIKYWIEAKIKKTETKLSDED